MSHYQNQNGVRCVSSTKTVQRKKIERIKSAQGKKKKEGRTEGKNRNIQPEGTLKIFLESDTLNSQHNFDGPRVELNDNYNKKKSHRDVSLTKKDVSRENAKGKTKTKKHSEATRQNTDKNKPDMWNSAERQLQKNKPVKITQQLQKHETLLNEKTEVTKTAETTKKIETKSSLAPLNSLFTLRKSPEKVETIATVHIPQITMPTLLLTQKLSGKVSEVKMAHSESGKIRINEILKGHAQKMQPVAGKTIQMKESGQVLVDAKSGIKEEKEGKQETEKDKSKVKQSKDSGEVKEVTASEEKEGEKRKVPKTWIKVPQSNELERRLRVSWDGPILFPHTKDTSEESRLKKVGKTLDTEEEEEGKTEKRVTYTDRLLVVRSLGKEKKMEEGNEKSVDSATAVTPLKRYGSVMTNELKTVTITLGKQISTPITSELESLRQVEGEHIIKTKSTRSSELRDLVSHAVKEHKIFCIFDNHWYIVRPVREELLSRGWLEVIPDRKLIPRRRPPPMGPTCDRDKSFLDRNCNTLEALLAAKEAFADELQQSVSQSASLRNIPEKIKIPVAPTVTKKSSDESLNEVLSMFRIIPPTTEKKKNNLEIREFVSNYKNALEEKEKDKKGKEGGETGKQGKEGKEKNSKFGKKEKEKGKAKDHNAEQTKQEKRESPLKALLEKSKSLEDILLAIDENKKAIRQATAEIKGLESRILTDLGPLFQGSKTQPALESGEKEKEKEVKVHTEKTEADDKSLYKETEAKMISKIIQSTNARIHFMWLSIKPSIHLKCFNYSPEIVNKFQKTTFCTKIGLWSHLNTIQWYAHEVHFPAKSPRMYNTGEADDLQAFFQDFQLTACIGMLKWLSDTFFDRGIKAVQTKKGKVPLKAFEFAIKQCEKYIRFKDNEDLGIMDDHKALKEDWNTFLQWFYIITNDHGKVQESSSAQLMVVYTKAIETLKTMKRHWPEMDIDGRLNIWIMKPYCASCGRGIFMTNNVYYIGQHSKYIVQKYIERPLLIYNTKFDIRQWFMITKLTPLEIWMYKECYLRFCTQPFALRNLHESVHLSNNSVQRKYINFRDPGLPDQNMWDSNTFQLYLKTIGHPNTWQDIIYPGMRDAIVSTMLAAQDTFDGPRRSWFEVYGADFMLSANLKEGPWLIEINENPAMDPSTKVTARLCPQMLRDVIKVVVDKRNNKNASTGEWELVYRQNYSPSFGTVDIDVKGKKIARMSHVSPTLNLPRHPSSSPSCLKRQDWNELERTKLYEVVQGYAPKKNSRASIHKKTQEKEKEKEKASQSRLPSESTIDQTTSSHSKLWKPGQADSVKESENKNHTKINESTEKNEEKIVSQQITATADSVGSTSGGEKRVDSSSKETLEISKFETVQRSFTAPVPRLTKREGRKSATGPDQSSFEDDKYFFTKFYQV